MEQEQSRKREMFKYLGLIALFFIILQIGKMYADKLTIRCKSLSELRRLFTQLKNEIALRQTPLLEALKKIGEENKNSFFISCSKSIERFGTKEGAKRAIEEVCDEYKLKKEDIDILNEVASGLGKCDLNSEINHIDFIISLLETDRIKADAEKEKLSPLITKCFMLLGAVAVITLL